MSTHASSGAVADTLRRRARLLLGGSTVLWIAAQLGANPSPPYPDDIRMIWPQLLIPASFVITLAVIVAGFLSVTRGGGRGTAKAARWTGGVLVIAGIYWATSHGWCSERLCDGVLGAAANWWLYWGLLVASMAGVAIAAASIDE